MGFPNPNNNQTLITTQTGVCGGDNACRNNEFEFVIPGTLFSQEGDYELKFDTDGTDADGNMKIFLKSVLSAGMISKRQKRNV